MQVVEFSNDRDFGLSPFSPFGKHRRGHWVRETRIFWSTPQRAHKRPRGASCGEATTSQHCFRWFANVLCVLGAARSTRSTNRQDDGTLKLIASFREPPPPALRYVLRMRDRVERTRLAAAPPVAASLLAALLLFFVMTQIPAASPAAETAAAALHNG